MTPQQRAGPPAGRLGTRRRPAAAALLLLLACLGGGAPRAAAMTQPDQLQIITAFRDAMLARPVSTQWAKALATWTCPTNPGNSVGGDCDPCGQQVRCTRSLPRRWYAPCMP